MNVILLRELLMEFDDDLEVVIQLPKAMIPEDQRDNIHVSGLDCVKYLDTMVKHVVLTCDIAEHDKGIIAAFSPEYFTTKS